MIKVVGIDHDDFDAVRVAFTQNYGSQTNNRIVITDFNKMKQRSDESVQQFFTRIGDIAYNYDLKKPNDAIRNFGQFQMTPTTPNSWHHSWP